MSAEGLLDFVLLSKYEICSVLWGGLKLEGSHFVSLWPRRWISFETEGQYHFRPFPWYLFNWRWVSHKSYGEIRVSASLCQLRAFQILCSYFIFIGVRFFILLTRFAKNTFDHLIFNFALPFWEHCALLCWYRDSLPFLNHYTSPEWVSNLKCSVGGSQATWV